MRIIPTNTRKEPTTTLITNARPRQYRPTNQTITNLLRTKRLQIQDERSVKKCELIFTYY